MKKRGQGEGAVEALAQGDLDAASCWADGARLAAATGDLEGQAHSVAGEGLVALAEVALAAGRRRNDRLAIYIALFTTSQVALQLGDHRQSRSQLEEGILLSEGTGDMANLAYFLDSLAVIESMEGRTRRVATLLSRTSPCACRLRRAHVPLLGAASTPTRSPRGGA